MSVPAAANQAIAEAPNSGLSPIWKLPDELMVKIIDKVVLEDRNSGLTWEELQNCLTTATNAACVFPRKMVEESLYQHGVILINDERIATVTEPTNNGWVVMHPRHYFRYPGEYLSSFIRKLDLHLVVQSLGRFDTHPAEDHQGWQLGFQHVTDLTVRVRFQKSDGSEEECLMSVGNPSDLVFKAQSFWILPNHRRVFVTGFVCGGYSSGQAGNTGCIHQCAGNVGRMIQRIVTTRG